MCGFHKSIVVALASKVCIAWLVLAPGIGLSGCASIDRLVDYPEPPQIYGGTRTFLHFWTVEIGGSAGPLGPVVLGDFGATLILDTFALPWTIYAEVGNEKDEDPEPEW